MARQYTREPRESDRQINGISKHAGELGRAKKLREKRIGNDVLSLRLLDMTVFHQLALGGIYSRRDSERMTSSICIAKLIRPFGNRSFTSWNSSNTTTARFFPESSFCGRSRTSVNASAPICSSDGSKENPPRPHSCYREIKYLLTRFFVTKNFVLTGLPGLSQPRICRMTMLATPGLRLPAAPTKCLEVATQCSFV